MSSLNPFFDDLSNSEQREIDFDEITLNSDVKDSVAGGCSNEISLDDIASKLIRDNFILTALELHTELAEARKEVPRLRDPAHVLSSLLSSMKTRPMI